MDELISTPLTANQLRALQHLINDRIHAAVLDDQNVAEEYKFIFAHGHGQAKLKAQHVVCDVLGELSKESE